MAQLHASAPSPTKASRRLFAAIDDGDEGGVEAALRDGASVNSLDLAGQNKDGFTPVVVAAVFGHVDVVRMLHLSLIHI